MAAQGVLNRQLMSAIEQPQEASPDKHLLASFEAMNSSSSPRGLDRQDRKKVACYLQMPQGKSERVLDHGSASPKVSSSREVSTQEKRERGKQHPSCRAISTTARPSFTGFLYSHPD